MTDVNAGPGHSSPVGLTPVGGTLYFFAANAPDANALYAYTAATGVALVKDIRPGGNDFTGGAVAVAGGELFFTSFSGTPADAELWASDGTADGTRRVKNIRVIGSSSPEQLFSIGDAVVFRVTTDAGVRLYRSDGTADGTYELSDVALTASPGGVPANMARVGDVAYFAGTRNGAESLWRSDGTVAGTAMVADVPLSSSVFPPRFAPLGSGALLFTGVDPFSGRELWKYTPGDPPLAAPALSFDGGPAVRFRFDRPLADVPPRVGFTLTRVGPGFATAVPAHQVRVARDAGAGVLTFTFPGFAGGLLPDGNYRINLPAGYARDRAGSPLPADAVFDFFVLGGDANRDRRVDFADLVKLAQSYDTPSGKTWADGDFTGDGAVDFNDLVVLAQRYDTALDHPPAAADTAAFAAAPTPATTPAPAPVKPQAKAAEKQTKSVFSTTPVAKAKPAPAKPKAAARPRGR